MIFTHASMIQEGESALFYRFNRSLNGYMVAGVFIAPNLTLLRYGNTSYLK